jgi:hypothetical protein
MRPRRSWTRSDGVIAIIPARAGSVRLPGKNMLPFAGKPMIQWTLEAALDARSPNRIMVSRDDEPVLDHAKVLGGMTALRVPTELVGPDASSMDVVRKALEAVGGTWDHLVSAAANLAAAHVGGTRGVLKAATFRRCFIRCGPTAYHVCIVDMAAEFAVCASIFSVERQRDNGTTLPARNPSAAVLPRPACVALVCNPRGGVSAAQCREQG